jgi:hypothetical protein
MFVDIFLMRGFAMKFFCVFAACCLTLGFGARATAQVPSPARGGEARLSLFDIDASSYPLVKAKCIALDGEKFSRRLAPENFSLSENGRAQTIVSLSCGAAKAEALSVVLTCDISGSMESGNAIIHARAAA